MPEPRFRRVFPLVLVIATSVALLVVLQAFLVTLLVATIASGLVYPVYTWFVNRLGGRRRIAATLTLLLTLLLVLLPVASVLGIAVRQAVQLTTRVRPVVERLVNNPASVDELIRRMPGHAQLAPYRKQIVARTADVVNNAGAMLITWLSATTRSTVELVIHVGLLLYAMFFLLLDGPAMLSAVLRHVPLSADHKAQMTQRFVSIARATIKGTIVIGLIQGLLSGLAFYVAGIPDALFWTVTMMVLSILPVLGGALVWVPACIILALTGHVLKAALVAAYCGLIVGSVDNVLRPRLVGRDTEMHDLLILFSTLGGLLVFGPLGFIIGPIIAGLFVTSWSIFAAAFQDAFVDGTESASSADR